MGNRCNHTGGCYPIEDRFARDTLNILEFSDSYIITDKGRFYFDDYWDDIKCDSMRILRIKTTKECKSVINIGKSIIIYRISDNVILCVENE